MSETSKFGLSPETIKMIYRVFRGYPEVEEVIIFGSRADGTYRPASDIDLAIKGKEIDAIMTENIRFMMQEGLYLPYSFDIVNYNAITNEKFKQHIDKFGVVFYQSGAPID